MKINLFIFGDEEVYFEVSTENDAAYTSRSISELFNINVDLYNQLVVDKVVKHKNYVIDKFEKDLTFKHNNISKNTYIERFKNTFINELTLLSLGGE